MLLVVHFGWFAVNSNSTETSFYLSDYPRIVSSSSLIPEYDKRYPVAFRNVSGKRGRQEGPPAQRARQRHEGTEEEALVRLVLKNPAWSMIPVTRYFSLALLSRSAGVSVRRV